ncbi:major capsid protein [Acinetobacter sp. ANC 5045]|uniref:major capsid protein n=1 Tax=Acinetobacter sp. ANC 5045 TaxID=2529851 RepID=UPI00103ACB67|nr:major capsid protein [Acinetobacter sp. ANC 5045]TCB14921.1 hypothetical protein E0H79_12000 [Acinetobacter sp. ANC 5045]
MTEQQKMGLAQVQVKKQSRLQTFLNRGAVVATVATATGAARADYDVSAIITNLGLAVTAAATIGVAWLGFTAGIAIWRNLRAAAK